MSEVEPRKKVRGRGPNKPVRPKDGKLYPKHVPVDENGHFDPKGKVDSSKLGSIALDEASARLQKESQDALRDHSKGVRTRLPADERARFHICAKEHPMALVSIEQVYPRPNQAIPAQPVQILRTWDEMNAYVRDNHWDGSEAKYIWRIGDNNNPQWTIGKLQYVADPNYVPGGDDMAKNNNGNNGNNGNGQQPPPQWPGYPPGFVPPGYGPPPGYGAPPGYGMPMPPWMPQMPWMQPQPQPAPVAPQAAPAPPAAPPQQMPWPPYPHPPPNPAEQALADQNRMMFQAFMEMWKQPPPQQTPQQPGYQQQDPQMMMWMFQMWMSTEDAKRKAAEIAAAQAAAAAAPPPRDKLDIAADSIDTLVQTINKTRRIADALDPDRASREEAASSASKKEDDEFPFAVKEIGIGRWVVNKKTGEPVDAVTAALMNADKIGDGLERVFDKFMNAWQNRSQMTEEEKKKHADEMRVAAQRAEIAARALAVEEERNKIARAQLMPANSIPTTVAQPSFVAQPEPVAVPQPAPVVSAPPPPPPPPPAVVVSNFQPPIEPASVPVRSSRRPVRTPIVAGSGA